MNQAKWISRDEIQAPMPAYGDGLMCDGEVVLTPDHKLFQLWADWLEQTGKDRPE